MDLIIASINNQIYCQKIKKVNTNAEYGQIIIYPLHAPLLTTIKPNILSYSEKNNHSKKYVYVSSGILEILPNKISIISDISLKIKIKQNYNSTRADFKKNLELQQKILNKNINIELAISILTKFLAQTVC